MNRLSASSFGNLMFIFCILTLCLILLFYQDIQRSLKDCDASDGFCQARLTKSSRTSGWSWTGELDLQESECRRKFPGLLKDIDFATKRGKFLFRKEDVDYKGLVQGRIKDNKLYIITTAGDTASQILHQRTSILSQLHRALITSPTKLPDMPFAFVVNDNQKNNSWGFARPNKDSDYNIYSMPSFAFWSWPSISLGAFDDVLARIVAVEKITPWEKKIDKAVWRGTPWFNPVGHPTLRQDLLKATRQREWADVEALNKSSGNTLAIEDFCRYKYVLYTEGVTYSGRLPYHQACESVLITPPLTYLTHTAWLLKPIPASELLAAFGLTAHGASRHGGDSPSALLATVRDWRFANAIYVSPKFEDLDDVIRLLRTHPELGRRIAKNQRDAVGGGGYLSGPAETCYWRALFTAWASNALASEEWMDDAGEGYESWLLKQVSGKGDGTRRRHGG